MDCNECDGRLTWKCELSSESICQKANRWIRWPQLFPSLTHLVICLCSAAHERVQPKFGQVVVVSLPNGRSTVNINAIFIVFQSVRITSFDAWEANGCIAVCRRARIQTKTTSTNGQTANVEKLFHSQRVLHRVEIRSGLSSYDAMENNGKKYYQKRTHSHRQNERKSKRERMNEDSKTQVLFSRCTTMVYSLLHLLLSRV